MTSSTMTTAAASAATESGTQSTPIAEYALLADCNSAALVSRAGSVDWLCLPRYDSPARLRRLLGPDAGHWSIRPAGAFTSERRYLPGTLVLETTFTTDTGTVKADRRDGVRRGPARPRPRPRRSRTSCCAWSRASRAPSSSSWSWPRGPSTGSCDRCSAARADGGRTFGGPNRIAVTRRRPGRDRGRHDARLLHGRARASRSASRCAGPPSRTRRPSRLRASDVAARIEDTVEGWRSWEREHDIYDGPHRDLVRFSSRVLKGLTYRPTGAIVAAADHLAARGRAAASATGTTASPGSATRA